MKKEANSKIVEILKKYKDSIDDFRPLLPTSIGAKNPTTFNLISELHLDNKNMYENAHTRVLAAILRFDNRFLESFLERCGIKHTHVRINGRIDIDVERQYTKKGDQWYRVSSSIKVENAKNCRPDCLIWKGDQFAIIIENKINGAPETENQVDNYIYAISGGNDDDIKLKNNYYIWVIYLGGDTEDLPSSYSLRDAGPLFIRGADDGRRAGSHLRLVSYKNVVIPWLEEDVLPTCPFGMSSLTGGLQVYIDYLKKRFADSESEDNLFFASKEVTGYFQSMENNARLPFYKLYNDAKDFVNLADDDDENIMFFKALKYYYLNHHFRFDNQSHNKTWIINATGSYVYVWKKTWNRNQAKMRSFCDIYFELFPYQIDTYLSDPNNFKLSVTCSLKYKGKDDDLFNFLKEKGVTIVKNGDQNHDYVFNKADQKKGNQLHLESDGCFFDWFVQDDIIKEQSKKIDNLLKEYSDEGES